MEICRGDGVTFVSRSGKQRAREAREKEKGREGAREARRLGDRDGAAPAPVWLLGSSPRARGAFVRARGLPSPAFPVCRAPLLGGRGGKRGVGTGKKKSSPAYLQMNSKIHLAYFQINFKTHFHFRNVSI